MSVPGGAARRSCTGGAGPWLYPRALPSRRIFPPAGRDPLLDAVMVGVQSASPRQIHKSAHAAVIPVDHTVRVNSNAFSVEMPAAPDVGEPGASVGAYVLASITAASGVFVDFPGRRREPRPVLIVSFHVPAISLF